MRASRQWAALFSRLCRPPWFDVGEKPVDDVDGSKPFALRLEVGHDAVAQHRGSQRLDVFDRNRVAALEYRARLGAEDQILRSARAGAPFDEVLDVLGARRRFAAASVARELTA